MSQQVLKKEAREPLSRSLAMFQVLVALVCLDLPLFFQQLPFKRFPLSVSDSGRFFEVLTLLPFAYNSLFLNHTFEPLERFFQRLVFVYSDFSDRNHLPFCFTVKNLLKMRRFVNIPAIRPQRRCNANEPPAGDLNRTHR